MKKILFIEKTRGCSTPEQKAEALRRRGHLEAIAYDPMTGDKYKYYTMPVLHDFKKCAEVTIRGGRVVEVRNVSEDVLKQIKTRDAVSFGGF